MKLKHTLCVLACIIALGAIERLHSYQNGGFRPSKLISTLPSVLSTPSPKIDMLLDQSFRYYGKGGTSFVFLGDDGKTILKLFKHQHLFSKSYLFSIALPGITDFFRIRKIVYDKKKQAHKHHSFFFNSCKLAHEKLKEETGLIYLSPEPNSYFTKKIRLIDSWGFVHSIDLSRTEFAIQERADLFFPYLENLLRTQQKEKCKLAIDSLFALIERRCNQGIGDRDPNLLINFGFIHDKAVEFDLGSYFSDPRLKNPQAKARELFFSTYGLQMWLEKHSPDLLEYLLDRIAKDASQ